MKERIDVVTPGGGGILKKKSLCEYRGREMGGPDRSGGCSKERKKRGPFWDNP